MVKMEEHINPLVMALTHPQELKGLFMALSEPNPSFIR
tara:strand:- start:786 stop:899 length:114 start_codon:yes stop_codon:yes gene_type:complete